jgi:hypothetical protein
MFRQPRIYPRPRLMFGCNAKSRGSDIDTSKDELALTAAAAAGAYLR